MINFKSTFKSDYSKILNENNKKSEFKPISNNDIRISYGLNSERTRTSRDRFVKVGLSK